MQLESVRIIPVSQTLARCGLLSLLLFTVLPSVDSCNCTKISFAVRMYPVQTTHNSVGNIWHYFSIAKCVTGDHFIIWA